MFYSFFNTFANFQDYVNKILVKKCDVLVIIYLDNIPTYIKNAQ